MLADTVLKPLYSNLLKEECDLSQTLSKEEIDNLGFKGRFWSTPFSKKITLKNLASNVLCEPKSFREIIILVGIIGIKPLHNLADTLYREKQMDEFSYKFFLENEKVAIAYQESKNQFCKDNK